MIRKIQFGLKNIFCGWSYQESWFKNTYPGIFQGFWINTTTIPTIRSWIYYSLSAHFMWTPATQRHHRFSSWAPLRFNNFEALLWIRLYEFLTKIPSFCIVLHMMIWGYMRDFANLCCCHTFKTVTRRLKYEYFIRFVCFLLKHEYYHLAK